MKESEDPLLIMYFHKRSDMNEFSYYTIIVLHSITIGLLVGILILLLTRL